jgi:DNA polymerase-3 subunit gamma/tau
MDSRTLTEELIAFLRNGFLALMAPDLVQVPSNRLDALAAQAQRLGAAGLVRGIEVLGTALADMRNAPDPRVLLDVATVQLTADSVGGDTGALVQRIERLERQVAAGVAAPPEPKPAAPVDPSTGRAALGGRARPAAPPVTTAQPEAASGVVAAPSTSDAEKPDSAAATAPVPPAAAATTAVAANTAITADSWENTIRPALRGMARAVYAPAGFVRSTDSTLTLSVPNAAHRAKCEEQRAVVQDALAKFAGSPVTVELVDGDGGRDGGRDGGGEGSSSSTPPARSSVPSEERPDTSGVAAESSPRERGLASAAAIGAAAESADDSPPAPNWDLPDDDDVDLDDLIDAPPESVKSPIDRLAEAFPGSELIEEAG